MDQLNNKFGNLYFETMLKFQATVGVKLELRIARCEVFGKWLEFKRLELWLKDLLAGRVSEPPVSHIGKFKAGTIKCFDDDAQEFILLSVTEIRKKLEDRLHA